MRLAAPGRFWSLAAVAAGVTLSTAALIVLGYGALKGWQQSAGSLSERRAEESADLLLRALNRDMRGAQTRVLTSARGDEFVVETPHDVVRIVAGAFARYPYPDAFFSWRSDTPGVSFFARSDRPPRWLRGAAGRSHYPVSVVTAPLVDAAILDRIREDGREGRRFSAFEADLGAGPQQVIARLLYRDALRQELEAVFGFTVDLAWVRQQYFRDLVHQVSAISRTGGSRALVVRAPGGQAVTALAGRAPEGPMVRRAFALTFFDPASIGPDRSSEFSRSLWTIEVPVAEDPELAAALGSTYRTLAFAAFAALTMLLGLGLSLRAAQASARLAEMRSEFVAGVTHELRTPIAAIRALGDTLVAGRVSDPGARQEYAQLVVQETRRLGRLIDNLLAYARVTDVADFYRFESLSVSETVARALDGFRSQVETGGFEVRLSVPADLPAVRADRTALGLLIENLLDNAIRYSRDERLLDISAHVAEGCMELSVGDRGIGIPADEVDKVGQRFFRGRLAAPGGSGLGLAISRRIAEDHGGQLKVTSGKECGTTVRLTLPLAS